VQSEDQPEDINFSIDFSQGDNEVNQIIAEENSELFTRIIQLSSNNLDSNEEIELNFEQYYDLRRDQAIEELRINLGSGY
ncbi:unnamed protein product, partial [Brachionus calyciflorus]